MIVNWNTEIIAEEFTPTSSTVTSTLVIYSGITSKINSGSICYSTTVVIASVIIVIASVIIIVIAGIIIVVIAGIIVIGVTTWNTL